MRRIREVAPGALAYVTTYPNPLSAPSCPAIGMDEGESRFLTHVFLPRLNDEIKLAAGLEGFEVIDLFDVFEHSGLCAEGPHRNGPAMNPWRFQNIDRLVAGPDDYLRGSMHPTAAGHALIAKKVEATVRHDLQRQRVPPSEPPSPPGSPSAADVPGSPPPTGAPPTGPPPIDVPPPEGPWTLRTNPCVRKAQRNENVVRPDGPLRVTGAKPGSPVCVAGFAQPFTRGTADTEGTFVVTTPRAVSGIGGRREAIYQRPDGTWVWRIEWAKPGTPDSGLSAFQAWLWRPWQLSLVALIAIVLVIAALVEHLVRKALNAMLDG
jgi:hypothetical protein